MDVWGLGRHMERAFNTSWFELEALDRRPGPPISNGGGESCERPLFHRVDDMDVRTSRVPVGPDVVVAVDV